MLSLSRLPPLVVALLVVVLAKPGDLRHIEAGSFEMCFGEAVTVPGTDGDDRLTGTDGPDVIAAGDGDDTLAGLGGDDILCGGAGNDLYNAGLGADVLIELDNLSGDLLVMIRSTLDHSG
jgi:Ca2+-binding RTX toxin-like protein